MQVLTVTALLCLSFVALSFQQPPGVPPKGHNQQFQQQQQNHQVPPPQHHQAPQHHHQQQGGGHGSHQQAGGHGHGHGHGQPLQFSSEVHNADHILEHLQNVVATKKKEDMTEEELEFHYFKLHDYDNNNKLDGVEIGKALTHFHDDEDRAGARANTYSDSEMSSVVEAALSAEDLNGDGYIEYWEFMTSKANKREPKLPGSVEQAV